MSYLYDANFVDEPLSPKAKINKLISNNLTLTDRLNGEKK
jgi:hypothetical protein